MPSRKGVPNLTPTKKARIWDRHNQHQTQKEIAHDLDISQPTVSKTLAQMHHTGDPYAKEPRSGCPKILDDHDKLIARRAIVSGECADASEVQREHFPNISKRTIRRFLADMGLNGRIRRTKPLLSIAHVRRRRVWAKDHLEALPEYWHSCFYSDECTFKLHGSDGLLYCRRTPGEEFLRRNIKLSVKGSAGKVNVSGFITYNGIGSLFRINGNMNGDDYRSILQQGLLHYLDQEGIDHTDILWVQDNDSKHVAKLTKRWFAEENIECMGWPAQSPDMNIIEHVWHHLKVRIQARNPPPRNAEQLWSVLQEEWFAIDLEFIRKLYHSIPDRIEALYRAKGWWTKY